MIVEPEVQLSEVEKLMLLMMNEVQRERFEEMALRDRELALVAAIDELRVLAAENQCALRRRPAQLDAREEQLNERPPLA